MITQSKSILTLALVLALGAFGSTALAQNINGSAVIDAEMGTTLVDSDVSGDASAGTDLRLGSDDARVQSSETSLTPAASVSSDSELETFAAQTLRDNQSLRDVNVSSSHVALAFNEEAKLLGFIPLTMSTRLSVSADGTVSLTRPWYSFLAVRSSEHSTASLEARVAAMIEGAKTADGRLTARGQAALIEEISLSLGSAVAATRTNADIASDTMLDAGSSSDDRVVAPQ